MFKMERCRIIQWGVAALGIINLIALYFLSRKSFTTGTQELMDAIIRRYAYMVVIFVAIITEIVIVCIRKDVEELLKMSNKRYLDEIEELKQ